MENNSKPLTYRQSLNSIIRIYRLLLKDGKISYNGSGFRRMVELENKLKK